MGYPRPARISSLLADVLERGPEDAAVLTVLAAMAMDNNNLQQAREYYERARLLPDAEETAIQGLLKIAYLSGEWEQAVELADEVIAINSGHAGAHAMKADALVSLGEVDAGIESARTALRLNPTLLPVHEWLAETLGNHGRIDEQRAEEEMIRRMRTAVPPR
jgi:tetratricopeptide (TPR) repeat protein